MNAYQTDPALSQRRSRWENLWRRLHAPVVPMDVFDELIGAYSSPGRFYHDLAHIDDCLALLDEYRSLADRADEVELAIWFHDVVYNSRGSDNEQRSAQLAHAAILQSGLERDIADRIAALILATRHSGDLVQRDAQLLVDIDLSILGRPAHIFAGYEMNIRREYAWVEDELFREKRAEVLRGFLERDHIYHLEEFRDRFEEQARWNLASLTHTRLASLGTLSQNHSSGGVGRG